MSPDTLYWLASGGARCHPDRCDHGGLAETWRLVLTVKKRKFHT